MISFYALILIFFCVLSVLRFTSWGIQLRCTVRTLYTVYRSDFDIFVCAFSSQVHKLWDTAEVYSDF